MGVARAVCFVVGVSLALGVAAKSIYSYRDANGVQHFTDQKPREDQSGVTQKLVRMEQTLRVRMREERGSDDRILWHLHNDYGGPVQIQIDATDVENVLTSPLLPAQIVVPAQSEKQVLVAMAESPFAAWRLQFSYQLVPGDPGAKPDLTARYLVPFTLAGGAEIHQAWGGRFSHTDKENYHAVDFALPIGTPVVAARAGVVVDVMDDYFETGLDPKLATKANSIRIVHTDGTMAVYAHIQLDAAFVSVGSRVRAGQQIARSGNSGFSSGPHLHFVVQRNIGMRLESIPFVLQDGMEIIEPVSFQRVGAAATR